MNGSIDLEQKIINVGLLQFNIETALSAKGTVYYKIIDSSNKIELGGFKINAKGKYTGGLTYHVEMLFATYSPNQFIFKRKFTGFKRYRMNKKRADAVSIKRTLQAKAKKDRLDG